MGHIHSNQKEISLAGEKNQEGIEEQEGGKGVKEVEKEENKNEIRIHSLGIKQIRYKIIMKRRIETNSSVLQ
jgi:hypothetical protein